MCYFRCYFSVHLKTCRRFSEIIQNVVSTEPNTKDLRISWRVIAQLVLGTVRIYKIQVESIYGTFSFCLCGWINNDLNFCIENALLLFINRPLICLEPVWRKRPFSTISESTDQPKRRRKDSELTLARVEPTRGRNDFSDPDFISDFLRIHEETPEVR